MDMALALFICFGIFAIGDYLGVLTKAKLSTVFVALLLFLVGFLSGILPPDIIKQARLTELSNWAAGFIIFHMGSMINLKQLAREWKTVLTTVLGMGVAAIVLLCLIPVIGRDIALAAIPVFNGGLVATAIMNEASANVQLPVVGAFATLLFAIKKFFGSTIASACGVREAREILKRHRARKEAEAHLIEKGEKKADDSHLFYKKYDKYFTDFVCIAIAAFAAFFASFISKQLATVGVTLHYTILCLLFGALVGYLNIIPPRILEKGRASGLLSIALFATLIPALGQIKLADLMNLGVTILIVLFSVIFVLFLVFYVSPLWKIKGSRSLSFAISIGQMLGFPSSFLISQEVSKAVTDDKEEQEVIMAELGTAYIVSGFASVTTLSIVTAGLVAPYIGH